MNKKLLFIFGFILLTSCKNKSEEKIINTEKSFQMYELSEMAAYMENLYKQHAILKDKIEKGNAIDSLPFSFQPFYEAEFTDPRDNDEEFQRFALLFESTAKQITKDSVAVRKNYNNTIDVCISCHQQKCRRPISRIKKLYINQ